MMEMKEYESYEGEMEYEAYFDYLKERMRRIVDRLHRLLDIEENGKEVGGRRVEGGGDLK